MSNFFIADLFTTLAVGVCSTLFVAAILFVKQQVLDFLRGE